MRRFEDERLLLHNSANTLKTLKCNFKGVAFMVCELYLSKADINRKKIPLITM